MSTPRKIKKSKLNSDEWGYSRALANRNKLAIVTDEYPVVRFREEQNKLVKVALEAALDAMSGYDYGPRFVPSFLRDATCASCALVRS